MKSKFSDSELLAIKLAWQEMERDRIIGLFTNPCTCKPEIWQCECGGENQINVTAIIKGEQVSEIAFDTKLQAVITELEEINKLLDELQERADKINEQLKA